MVERYIEKAAVLIEALPYIQSFRDKIIIVKFGGSVMDNEAYVNSIIKDIVFMHSVGMKPVIVHGGGGKISENMKKIGLQPKFVEGYRVTDAQTIEVVENTLVNSINKSLVDKIKELGAAPEGHSGKDFGIIKVKKYRPLVQNKSGEGSHPIDIGYVGEIESIDIGPVLSILDNDRLPIVASLGLGADGRTYNVNADEVAGEIAVQSQAEKLVFLTDVKGVMRNPKDEDSLISTLKVNMVEQLLDDKVIAGGMIPKIKACLRAVKSGVHKTHIIDGRITHSLLLEIFTDEGIGTQIIL